MRWMQTRRPLRAKEEDEEEAVVVDEGDVELWRPWIASTKKGQYIIS